MNVLEQLIGRVAKGNRRVQALAVLLQPKDLPGDRWHIAGEKAWRMGTTLGPPLEEPEEYRIRMDNETDESRRAREAAGYIGFRWFKSNMKFCTLAVSAAPFVSNEDAIASLPRAAQRVLERKTDKLERIESRVVERNHPSISEVLFVESDQLHDGAPCFTRYVYLAVGPFQVCVSGSRHDETCPWADIEEIATRQAEKIQKSLSR